MLEIVFASVVTLKLYLINHVLRGLLQCQVFDKVLKAQTVLFVYLRFLDFLVNYFLPSDVLWIGLKLNYRSHSYYSRVKVTRSEALCLNVDRHQTSYHWDRWDWLLLYVDRGCRLLDSLVVYTRV